MMRTRPRGPARSARPTNRRRAPRVVVAFGLIAGGLATAGLVAQQPAAAVTPTIDALLELERVGAPALSPDGTRVAYTLRATNWEKDAFETEIWVVSTSTKDPRPLTSATGSSSAPAWSPDGRRLAFLSDRTGTQQLHVMAVDGGEARTLTSLESGVTAFRWSPDGRAIAFTSLDPLTTARKDRDARYGDFEDVDRDPRMTHLHLLAVDTGVVSRVTEGAFTVGRFAWSPDGRSIAFDHRIDADPANNGSADISVVDVTSRERRPLVAIEGPDANPVWSPDGASIAFESAMGAEFFYYLNTRLAIVPAGGGTPEALAIDLDEDPSLEAWSADGLLFSASDRTSAFLYRVDPRGGAVTRLGPSPGHAANGFSFDRGHGRVAFVSSSATAFPDVHVAAVATMTEATPLTTTGRQIASWAIGSRDVIRWKSRDGVEIEGILHKPSNFTPGRRYPLLVVIHGGPTGISRPTPVSAGFAYPVELWLSRGALILQPNYRGSAGYGEAFRSLNVRNLGVGDAWDVVSGIDHLVAEGLVDRDRVGTMGWSQGGYISAFLATHDSARFKAASVGAGISNWMTYYVNTDIHPFTRQYLKSTPWDDPEIYARTSPMTYIKQARTPTLIQHGEKDQRVPPPNAFELYQGLQDQGTPTRLVIYKGFGHGLTKPKAQRAAMEHNLEWFDQHFFGTGKPTEPQG
jgi:dipeptidyl aminopeptidase/acylaminoacyl peptidase